MTAPCTEHEAASKFVKASGHNYLVSPEDTAGNHRGLLKEAIFATTRSKPSVYLYELCRVPGPLGARLTEVVVKLESSCTSDAASLQGLIPQAPTRWITQGSSLRR